MIKFRTDLSVKTITLTDIRTSVGYTLNKGDIIDSITVQHGATETVYEGYTLANIAIRNRVVNNAPGPVIDSVGLPSKHYDNVANIREASIYFEPYKIGLTKEEETVVVYLDNVTAIAGSFVAEDGSTTTVLTATEDGVVDMTEQLTMDNATIVAPAGAVTVDTNVTMNTKIIGENAGVPQNYEQEVL